MPRMVIHQHTREGAAHYDLMLESPQLLWTWRFQSFPGTESEQPCERIQDHDRKFLEYEGKLSGDKGEVAIVEAGTFALLHAQEDRVHLTARGHKVAGLCRLERKQENEWVLHCDR